MSRFVLKSDLDHEEFDWGVGRLALRAEADGRRSAITVLDVKLSARWRPRVPQARRTRRR